MRRVVLLLVAIFSATSLYAQSYLTARTVGAVEVELSVGLATASNRIASFGRSNPGVEVAAEVRYNFAQAPVDVGLSLSLCSFSRSRGTNEAVEKYNFDSQSLLVMADYNFFQGRRASLYVGGGAGIAWCSRFADDSRHGVAPCVMPRVGVELAERVRISLGYKFCERANSPLLLGVGFAFGGGKR